MAKLLLSAYQLFWYLLAFCVMFVMLVAMQTYSVPSVMLVKGRKSPEAAVQIVDCTGVELRVPLELSSYQS